MFLAQSTTRDYIRAEGDLHKKIYMVERANKTEIKLEEQSEKTESCQENLWIEIQLKEPKDRKRHKNSITRSGQTRLVYVRHKP